MVQPIADISKVVKAKGAFFHVDAVQGAGKVPFDVNEAKVDLVALSAHKIYGPKGVGALYVRRKPRVRLTPLGLLQYIGPSIQFLLGLFLYHETFDTARLQAFALIWAGLVVYTADTFWVQRHVLRKAAGLA